MSPPLRASNEGLLRPRVAQAQGTHRAIPPLLADFFGILLDGGIGKTQGEETAEAAFFRSEETGKAKPDPFGTTGTHDGAVNHDGIIILSGRKLQYHVTPHRNALTGENAAPPER